MSVGVRFKRFKFQIPVAVSCIPDMDEELEALQSVYDTLTVSHSDDGRPVLTLACTPRSAAASFVSATVEITLPAGYPATARPSFRVVLSSGLSDQGAAITRQTHESLRAAEPGEPVLFQLIDAVFDVLDAANQGECLICADGLSARALVDDADGAGLLTRCRHTFHAKCLVHWAGIVLAKAPAPSSSGSGGGGGGGGEVRALEGTIRAACAEMETLQVRCCRLEMHAHRTHLDAFRRPNRPPPPCVQASIDALQGQLDELAAPTAASSSSSSPATTAATAAETASLQQRIKERRGRLSACVEATLRAKGKPDKAALAEEAAALRRDIALDESRLAAAEAAARGCKGTADGADKEATARAATLADAILAATAKHAQRGQRLEQHRAELVAAQARAAQRAAALTATRSFPCPFCRAPLRAAGGADVGIDAGNRAAHADAETFRRLLDAAVADEEAKIAAATAAAAGSGLGSGSGSGAAVLALPSAPQSVFALPAELQTLVRKVGLIACSLPASSRCIIQPPPKPLYAPAQVQEDQRALRQRCRIGAIKT